MRKIVRCTECEKTKRKMTELQKTHEREMDALEKKLGMLMRELTRTMRERDEYKKQKTE